jgi:hypothetical protein
MISSELFFELKNMRNIFFIRNVYFLLKLDYCIGLNISYNVCYQYPKIALK